PVGERPLQTVHRFRNHLTQRELAGALRPREDYGVREVFVRQHLAQGVNHFGIAVKIGEGHGGYASAAFLFSASINRSNTTRTICGSTISSRGRASTSTTRCGSRLAISRNALRTRVKKAWLSFSKRFSSDVSCAAAAWLRRRARATLEFTSQSIRMVRSGHSPPHSTLCNCSTASLPSRRPAPW